MGLIQKLVVHLFNDAARGALPTLYAATQDIPSGSYVGPDGFQHLRGYPEVIEPPEAAHPRPRPAALAAVRRPHRHRLTDLVSRTYDSGH